MTEMECKACNLRPLYLEDKAAIEKIRRQEGHEASSHAFASLYVWQEKMKLEFELEEGFFAVKAGMRGENTWFFPCGSREQKKLFLESHSKERDFRLCYAREEDWEWAEQEFPGRFLFEENPGDGEYLYHREEQIELKGRRYVKLRNHCNHIKKVYEPETVVLGPENKEEAFGILRAWSRLQEENIDLKDTDVREASLFLSHWNELGMRGVMIYLEGEPKAVMAGFPLSDNSFDFCLSKQTDMRSGLSSYSKWELYRSLPETVSWINAEEDLGIEGLRRMKEQMKPDGMIRMYDGRVI